MYEIGIFIAGVLVGAVAMFSSFRRAQIMANRERERSERREERMRKERDAQREIAESVKELLEQMRIDQANNSGYVDGYQAGSKDTKNKDEMEISNVLLGDGLRAGKRIIYGVYDR